jgi:hypothetical protein
MRQLINPAQGQFCKKRSVPLFTPYFTPQKINIFQNTIFAKSNPQKRPPSHLVAPLQYPIQKESTTVSNPSRNQTLPPI